MEWGFALVAALINNLGGGKKSPADYMPYLEDPDEELSLEKAMETWN
jgi:hypothetical protein